MTKKAGMFVCGLLAAVGCGVGDDANEEPKDPNPNKIICTDAFKTQGTWTAAAPLRPVDQGGCWPVGTWTFTATLDPSDEGILDITGDQVGDRCGKVSGTQAATADASYSFRLDRTMDELGWVDTLTFAGDMTRVSRLKVSEGGGGECEGGIELFSADGLEHWNLHPALTGTVITGFGEYTKYKTPQR